MALPPRKIHVLWHKKLCGHQVAEPLHFDVAVLAPRGISHMPLHEGEAAKLVNKGE